ncbi:MCM-domain-containing protein, partial [Aureobasidium melanogenum]
MSSPLGPPESSAAAGGRKRQRDDEDVHMRSSSAAPPSSPPRSSPPPLPRDELDDDDDIIEPDEDLIPDLDDAEEQLEDDAGVDLFGDNFENDYRRREDDFYEGQDIDDEGEYDDLDLAARRQLDARLNRRDRELARQRRPQVALDEDEDDLMDLTRQPRRRRHRYDEEQDDMDMTEDIMTEELSAEGLADVKASNLTDWIAQPAVHRGIARELKAFLTEFVDDNGISVYGVRIRTLGENNGESLEIDWEHLSMSKPTLAYFIANVPTETLKIFDRVAMDVTLYHYPLYESIQSEIHVRINGLPMSYTLRELRQSHL